MLFNFSTKNSYEWCGDVINYYYYCYLFSTFPLSLIFYEMSKFDKNIVAFLFKELHIVPWLHQKIMLPLSFLEFNFAKWDTEKIIDD